MNSFKKVKACSSTIGFTLVELLLATFMTAFVIGGAGFGLVTMMRLNADNEAKSLRRSELNRAIEYISEDIRMANNISSVASDSVFPGSGTGVLLLSIPSDTTNPNRIYFIRSRTRTWMGDYTVNRAQGTYSNPVNLPRRDDSVLVDGLIAPPQSDLPSCTTSTGLQGDNGFYACVSDDRRIVDLYLYGKVNDFGNYIRVSTKVFARAN